MDTYRAVAEDMRTRGLVAEPEIDQLSVENGGLYITTKGLNELGRLRSQVSQAAAALGEIAAESAREIIRRAWPRFRDEGQGGSYKAIKKGLLLSSPPGTDVDGLFRALPPWMAYGYAAPGSNPMSLHLLGLVVGVGDGAMPVLEDFWRAFTLARWRLVSSGEEIEARLSSGDLGGSGDGGTLGMSEVGIRQCFSLLQNEMLLGGGSSIDDGGQYGWDYEIADRIHWYRDVESLEEYVRMRASEYVPKVQPEHTSDSIPEQHQPPPDPRKVFVIHGRDDEAKEALFGFLRALDLHPVDWEELVERTGKGTPYTGEVVDQAFIEAQAVVAVLTPDDEVRLHESLWKEDEEEHEKEFHGQPRPNVYFEAGMAFKAQPERTILVEIGRMRPASDLGGRNVVRLSDMPAPLNALKNRLKTAGCEVNDKPSDWLDTGRFGKLAARTRHRQIKDAHEGSLPTGQILKSAPRPAAPGLRATLYPRASGSYLLEVVNSGGVTLREVRWELPDGASNWGILDRLLPAYPIPELEARERVPRIPVSVTTGGPQIVELTLRAILPDGNPFETKAMLSIFG
jgi:predicted nucleotide-binding protein